MIASIPMVIYLLFTLWWMIYTNVRWASNNFLNVSIKVALSVFTIIGCFLLAREFGYGFVAKG